LCQLTAMSVSRADRAYSFTHQNKLQYLRLVVQLVCLAVLNGKLFGLASTPIVVPFLHTTQSPWSVAHGAFESLEYTMARGAFPLLVLGVIYLTAITVGRLFCGWACPMGLVQDLLAYLPFKKRRFSSSTHDSIKDIKWVLLGFSLLIAAVVGFRRSDGVVHESAAPAGPFSDSPFSVLSPASTLFAYVPWLILWKADVIMGAGILGWVKILSLIGVIGASVYYPRFFCRYICPMGALLEPVSRWKMLRINRRDIATDDLNKLLSDVCPTGVQASNHSDFLDSGGCIHCGKCVSEQPKYLYQAVSVC